MRATMILALLLGLAASGVQAAGWTDNGDGTWTLQADAVTVTTEEKDRMEQLRADTNYRYRCGGVGTVCAGDDQLDPSAWLASMLVGVTNTQAGESVPSYLSWCSQLWQQFKRQWVARSSSDPDADGLAITVPIPPAP